jgi:mannose-6-phosphate isomerase-like protein (cupin superfamily)
MKKYRLSELPATAKGHFLNGVLPGEFLCMGGLGFKPAGFRSHDNDGPGGSDVHVHENDHEAFVILQGKAVMEMDGQRHELRAGDICVVEPGENHHLVSDRADPCVNLWLHAGPNRHPDQQSKAGGA